MTDIMTISGALPRDLGNSVSDAIFKAAEMGMDVDAAACVVVQVAADYWVENYGADDIEGLVLVLRERARLKATGKILA